MKKGIAILAAAACAAVWAAAAEPRTWRFEAPERPEIQTQDSVEWVQGESVDLEYALSSPLADGQTALWEITQGSNLYSYAAAEAGETSLRWCLDPDQTTLPAGRYAGRVAVYSTAGGKTTFHRVLAQHGIRVYKGIADFEELQPVPWYDRTVLEEIEKSVDGLGDRADAAEADIADIAGDLATNARQIADLESETELQREDIATNAAAIAAHVAATDNPHGVTAEQVGALPTSWTNAAAVKTLSVGSYSDSLGLFSVSMGFLNQASAPYSFAAGVHSYATNDRSYVWSGLLSSFCSHGSGTFNIDPNHGLSGFYVGDTNLADHLSSALAPVEDRVDAIETDYLTSTDAAAFATTDAVASALAALAAETSARTAADSALGGRVDALETAAWSELYTQWPTSILTDSGVNWITTNWPARSIVVCVTMGSMTNLTIGIPGGWEPEEDCMVTFRILRGGSSGSLDFTIGENQCVNPITSGSNRGCFAFRWRASDKVWVLWRWNLTYANAVWDSSGANKESIGIHSDERFLPVIGSEEAAPALAMSPSPTFLSPAALQTEEEPLDEPDFDAPQDPETDR